MNITYPRGLKRGDRIAITAPSSGLKSEHFPRLNLVLSHLRDQGFDVVEGDCLKSCGKHVSGPKEARAQELMRFWEDDDIAAIMPPWGGETLVEILPLLDFERMTRSPAKWISGYSDISTLLWALTLKTNIATMHGPNLMDLAPAQTDPLTTGLMNALSFSRGDRLVQTSSERFQKKWVEQLKQSPIAVMTEAANEQHYEVPAEFFCQVAVRGCRRNQRATSRRL